MGHILSQRKLFCLWCTFLPQETVQQYLPLNKCFLCLLALFPPCNRIRPRTPPPPPPAPTNPAEAKLPKFPTTTSKIFEQLEKSILKKVVKPTVFYENGEFHNKTEAALSVNTTCQQTPPPRRTGTVNVTKKLFVNLWLSTFSWTPWLQLIS